MNVVRTLLVCVCLAGGSYILQRDAEILVLNPLEGMIERVKGISKKPMALISMEKDKEKENDILEMEQELKGKKKKKKNKLKDSAMTASENDALLLEYSLFQIGKLLGICFGIEGAKVIGLNISHSDTGGDFNNDLHGDGVNNAVFGFC
jgi:hypothetical protein